MNDPQFPNTDNPITSQEKAQNSQEAVRSAVESASIDEDIKRLRSLIGEMTMLLAKFEIKHGDQISQ